MNNFKELIKPGLIVDVKDGQEDIPYVVVDCMDGIQLMCIYDCDSYIPLRDFDSNLKYVGTYQGIDHISAVYKVQKCNDSIDDGKNRQIIWIAKSVKVTLDQIAKQFGTTVDKLEIVNEN